MILTPRVKVATLQGERILSFTMLSLYTFETLTGYQLGSEGQRADHASIRAFLHSLIIPFQQQTTLEQTGALWSIGQLPDILQEAVQLVGVCLPIPKPQRSQDGAKPLQDWYQIWAAGRLDMHFSEHEFWMLTPLMFQAVVDRLALAAGVEPEPTVEEKSKRVLAKVEQLVGAGYGVDMRRGVQGGY